MFIRLGIAVLLKILIEHNCGCGRAKRRAFVSPEYPFTKPSLVGKDSLNLSGVR